MGTRQDLIDSLPNTEDNIVDKPLRHYLPARKESGVRIPDAKEDYSEHRVVQKCIDYMKAEGWICKSIYTGGIPLPSGALALNPSRGIPDYICFNTKLKKMLWIEFKKSKGGLVSSDQAIWHKLIELCGGFVFVINSLSLLKEKLYDF